MQYGVWHQSLAQTRVGSSRIRQRIGTVAKRIHEVHHIRGRETKVKQRTAQNLQAKIICEASSQQKYLIIIVHEASRKHCEHQGIISFIGKIFIIIIDRKYPSSPQISGVSQYLSQSAIVQSFLASVVSRISTMGFMQSHWNEALFIGWTHQWPHYWLPKPVRLSCQNQQHVVEGIWYFHAFNFCVSSLFCFLKWTVATHSTPHLPN